VTPHPLAGTRVLITRDAERSAEWAEQVAALGMAPIILTCVRALPRIPDETRVALKDALRSAQWVLFTSARAVETVARAGVTLARGVRIAAVGNATADAVRQWSAAKPFVAHGGTSAALGDELLELWGAAVMGMQVVVIGVEGGRDDAERVLVRAGALVTRVDVYRTIAAAPAPHRRDLGREGIDAVLLASPSAVTGLLNQADVGADTRCFTIGPTTSAAARAAGLMVAGEAKTPNLEGLLEAMQCTIGA